MSTVILPLSTNDTCLGLFQKPRIRVRLQGVLGRKFRRVHYFRVSSVAEAINALEANAPGFKAFLQRFNGRLDYAITTRQQRQGLAEDELHQPITERQIVIRPVACGSGGGFLRIIAGIGLIIASVAIPFAAAGGGTLLGLAGASLVLGGVAQLMAPKPDKFEEDDRQTSTLGNALAVATYGEPVPVLLGGPFLIKDMPVASASIQAESF